MSRFKSRIFTTLLGAGAVLLATTAQAQWAVVDVGAIGQLLQQLITMKEQLDTVKSHLQQAKDEYASITGSRGMEHLLQGTVRNYLPADWQQLSDAVSQAGTTFHALAADVQHAIDANAVLSQHELESLSPTLRQALEANRRSAAMLQVTTRQALATSSSRFEAIQQLIDAIPHATDQKAILDLQARIQAEEGMLSNEQTKLDVIYQAAQAEELARKQRTREQAVAGIGRFRDLPPLNLPMPPSAH
jgi:type IV secretion system protein VirB5